MITIETRACTTDRQEDSNNNESNNEWCGVVWYGVVGGSGGWWIGGGLLVVVGGDAVKYPGNAQPIMLGYHPTLTLANQKGQYRKPMRAYNGSVAVLIKLALL
jgi:hypothetical protein